MPAEYPLLAISRLRMETDGDGVTTLVAGSGCPLSCRYCINREPLTRAPKWVTPEQLFDRVKIDDLYFQATGGGLTFGGGEALLHADYYAAFQPLCPHWQLCAETSLHVPHALLETAAAVLDAFIVDVKTLDPEIYRRYTACEIGPVPENLAWLLSHFDPDKVKIRVPLIPDFNTPEGQAKTVETVRSLGATNVETFSYVRV